MLPGMTGALLAGAGPASATTYAKLLLHCDGANGSTSFPDASSYGRTVTANGNAAVSTAQSKFGGASAAFDGTGDYLSVPDASDLELTGDFTIDFWIRVAAAPVTGCSPLTKSNAAGYGPYEFYMTSARALAFYASSTGSSWDIASGKTFGTLALNTWTHVAVVRSGNTYYLFKDGTQTDTWISSATPVDIADTVKIGGRTAIDSNTLNGWLDEVRLSGVARWTSGFTPPTSAYASD